jgi:hypothetical protein
MGIFSAGTRTPEDSAKTSTSTVIEMAEEAGDHRFVASLMKQRYGDSWADTDTGVEADTVNVEVSERVRNTFPE